MRRTNYVFRFSEYACPSLDAAHHVFRAYQIIQTSCGGGGEKKGKKGKGEATPDGIVAWARRKAPFPAPHLFVLFCRKGKGGGKKGTGGGRNEEATWDGPIQLHGRLGCNPA